MSEMDMSLAEKTAYAEKLEKMLTDKIVRIAYYDQCVSIEVIATFALNQFQQHYTHVIIKNDPLLRLEETCLMAAKTKAWNDRFAAWRTTYPPTLEDVLWIVAKNGYSDHVAKLINLSKFTRICKNLQPVMREIKNKDGFTQLHFYCRMGLVKSVVRMLSMRSIDVEARDKRGWSCLMRCVQDGNTFICKLLLQNGALVDSINNDGLVPLNYATVSGNLIIFTLLCDFGANISAQNRKVGWTPLYRAIWYGHVQIVKELVQRGVDVNTRDSRGETALTVAVGLERSEIVKLLLDNKGIA
jgi:hypothetical protein